MNSRSAPHEETSEEPGGGKETARIEAFSDGVFAIAITLLILELKVPPVEQFGGHGLARALGQLWPSYLAFFMSFSVILVMWVNHHRIFTLIRKVDDAFLYWNGLLLFFVTVVPFPTSLLAAYLLAPEAKTAAAVYAAVGFLIALAFTGLWRHAIKRKSMLARGGEAAVAELSRQYRYGPFAYLLAFALAFVSAWLSVGVCLLLAVFFASRGFLNLR
jgi:uncharacterized membrane protein